MMNKTSTAFEDRIRATLHARAQDIQAPLAMDRGEVAPVSLSVASPRTSRRRVAALAAAAAVVTGVLVGAALLRPSNEQEISTVPADQPGGASSLPGSEPANGTAPGAGFVVVWPNDATTARRSDPVTTARSFAEEVVGQPPTSAAADPDAPARGPTRVDVAFDATQVRILTVPTEAGWVVLQVGDGGLGVTTDPPSVHPPAVAGAVDVEVRIDTVAGITTVVVAADRLPDGVTLPTAGTDLRSIVAVYRGSQGEVIAVNGGHFG